MKKYAYLSCLMRKCPLRYTQLFQLVKAFRSTHAATNFCHGVASCNAGQCHNQYTYSSCCKRGNICLLALYSSESGTQSWLLVPLPSLSFFQKLDLLQFPSSLFLPGFFHAILNSLLQSWVGFSDIQFHPVVPSG